MKDPSHILTPMQKQLIEYLSRNVLVQYISKLGWKNMIVLVNYH
jgi:hypothetical protein